MKIYRDTLDSFEVTKHFHYHMREEKWKDLDKLLFVYGNRVIALSNTLMLVDGGGLEGLNELEEVTDFVRFGEGVFSRSLDFEPLITYELEGFKNKEVPLTLYFERAGHKVCSGDLRRACKFLNDSGDSGEAKVYEHHTIITFGSRSAVLSTYKPSLFKQ